MAKKRKLSQRTKARVVKEIFLAMQECGGAVHPGYSEGRVITLVLPDEFTYDEYRDILLKLDGVECAKCGHIVLKHESVEESNQIVCDICFFSKSKK